MLLEEPVPPNNLEALAAVREKSPKRYYSLALKYAPFERTFDTAALKKKIEAYK